MGMEGLESGGRVGSIDVWCGWRRRLIGLDGMGGLNWMSRDLSGRLERVLRWLSLWLLLHLLLLLGLGLLNRLNRWRNGCLLESLNLILHNLNGNLQRVDFIRLLGDNRNLVCHKLKGCVLSRNGCSWNNPACGRFTRGLHFTGEGLEHLAHSSHFVLQSPNCLIDAAELGTLLMELALEPTKIFFLVLQRALITPHIPTLNC